MKNSMIMRRTLSFLLTFTLICGMLAGTGLSVYADTVASIGGVGYESLEAAVASAQQGDIIILNSDAYVSSTVNINGKAVYITAADGGYSIRRASGFDGAIFDIYSGELGIYSGVTVDGEGRSVSSTLVRVSGGSFTMDSGCSIQGNSIDVSGGAAVNVNSGSFSFMGGSISSVSNVAVYIDSGASFRMSGDAAFGAGSALRLGGSSYIEIPAAINLSSDVAIYADNLSDGRTIAQLGGISLTQDQLSRFKIMGTDEIYSVVQSGTRVVAHKESEPEQYTEVVEYNGEKYDNLNDAIADVREEYATLYLLKSFTVDYNTVIDGDKNIYIVPKSDAVVSRADGYTGTMFTVESGTTLTLGGTLQVNGAGIEAAGSAFAVMGVLTLESGVIITNHNGASAVSVTNGSFAMNGGSINGNVASNGTVNLSSSSFVMNAGQIKSNRTVNGGGVYANDSTLDIRGGDICLNNASNGGGVYIAKGSMAMSGGRIYGNTAGSGASVYTNGSVTLSGSAALAANSSVSVYLGADALINVADGWSPEAVSGYNGVITVAMNEYKLNRVVVSFASSPVSEAFALDASQQALVLKAVGNNLVVAPGNEGDVAYFNNRGYATLEEAFAAIPDNGAGTVYLVGDAQVAQTIIIKPTQNLTLSVTERPGAEEEFTGRRVTRFEGFDGAIFDIPKGATFAIGAPEGKSLSIDGELKTVKDSAFIVKGVLDIGVGASIVNHNFVGTENAATGVFTYGGGVRVESGGVCMLSGGTVSGCYASYGGGISLDNGTLTLSKGYISGNTALFGGGIYSVTTKPEETAEPQTDDMTAPLLRSVINISEGIITQNKAISNAAVPYSGMGGGLLVGSGAYCSVTGGSINGNTAVYGGGISVGEVPVFDENIDEMLTEACDFILSDKVYIAQDNDIYLAYPELNVIKVKPELKSQTTAITVTLPDHLPANIPVVQYVREIPAIDPAAADEPETVPAADTQAPKLTAQPAIDKPLFKLDENAAKYFALLLSEDDPSVIIAGIKNGNFGGIESGKVFNGLKRFEEADGVDEPIPVVYDPITLGSKGVFTAHYEFTYPTALYTGFTRSITAPLPKGTYITLIDYNVKGQAYYYYYKVTGEEKVIKGENLVADLPDGETPVYTPDVIEIPLNEFMKMGTTNQYYKDSYETLFDTEAEFNTERMVFIVDFTYAELSEGYTMAGDFRMEWNHYIPVYGDILCDITGSECCVDFSVTDSRLSEAYIDTDGTKVTVSYTLGADSLAANRNCGVVLLRLNGRYPAGTYFTDADGNVYSVPTRSSVAAIPMPRDSRGNVIRKAELELTVANYYGTSIPGTDIYAMLCASNDGEHYSAFTECDAESDYVVLNLAARDKYAILVTNTGNEDKPFFDGITSLNKDEFIEMNVKATMNSADVSEFTLFLQKKTKDGYENCPLSELFKIEDQEIMSVALATGKISLEPVDNLEALLKNEFKIGFSIGDKTEFVKVNVTKD